MKGAERREGMLQLQRTVKPSGLAQQNLTKGVEKQLPGVIRNHRKRLKEQAEELRLSSRKA